jgi:hypothetical protein
MYDCGLNSRGGRSQAVFSRLNGEEVERRVVHWLDQSLIREQIPPTMTPLPGEFSALVRLEHLASIFGKAWQESLAMGFRPEENRFAGPARDKLLSLIRFWLPNFQH